MNTVIINFIQTQSKQMSINNVFFFLWARGGGVGWGGGGGGVINTRGP